jgi:hypothetical protein
MDLAVASQHRKRRGAATARIVADWFRDHGWPYATAIGAGAPGRDIENMPGLAPVVLDLRSEGEHEPDVP